MEWAKRPYREGLMRGRGELPKARSILIMDNLHAQTKDDFKECLAKQCNTLAWYGPSECTDEVQPVDAGAGRFFKVEVGRQMDIWLEQPEQPWQDSTANRPSDTAFPKKCGMAMTVDGSGDDRTTLEGLDKPYTFFAKDEDSSEDEQGSENGSDEPEGRGQKGDGGYTSLPQTYELTLLGDDYKRDPQDPEDEIQGMEIPASFRIKEAKPVALDRLFWRRGVLVKLGMGALELHQSTCKMRLPFDKCSGDPDTAAGSWVLLDWERS
ncbi:unnamed protein product [Ectocarpus sp. CCAP 1310/34]|nr:unnamed protein product [Ectocarpus sp. CCAP 1310/34]